MNEPNDELNRRDEVRRLAEEFAERLRSGGQPDVEDFVRHIDSSLQDGWWHDSSELLEHMPTSHRALTGSRIESTPIEQRVSQILEHSRKTRLRRGRPWLRSLRPPHLPVTVSGTILPHKAEISAAAFSCDAATIATVAGSVLQLWERGTGTRLTAEIPLRHEGVNKLAFFDAAL